MPFCKHAHVDLYFEQTGEGPPVLLIQGVGACGEAWRPQVNGLAPEFTTLLFDNRGIGQSQRCSGPISIETMAEDVGRLLDVVGWKSAHIVGHSMGGVIAQQFALEHRERVRSLSLLCTFARAKLAARLTPWVLWMTLKTRLGSRASRRKAFLEMLFPKDFLAQADLDLMAKEVAQLVGRDLATHPPILMQQLRAMARHDSSSRLSNLDGIPTLVISAEHDRIAPPQYGKAIADGIRGASFEEWKGTAHGVIIQAAAKLNQRLNQFFKTSELSLAGSPFTKR